MTMAALLHVVGWADVLDVLLVATLVYPAVVWVRRTQAGLVAVGLLILAALYVGAQVLDLRLTTWLLQGFFAAILVVVVVIFQEEIRQLFERLAVWSLRRGRRPTGLEASLHDTLVQALADMARDRVGALVVLQGTQPLDRYVHGGIALDGAVSLPLLRSIFDPHSPGHDGAVIIRGDRVTRFATHLPLSNDLVQLGGVGTRHTAALGLAEVTDALCLVVSEERGEISIARDGRLRRRLDPGDLGRAISDFTRSLAPEPATQPFWRAVVHEHGLEKVVTLVAVAMLWWTLVPGSRPVERTLSVPVRVVDLPAGMILRSVDPSTVSVTLSGRSRDFYFVGPRNVAVSVDASPAAQGRRTFPLRAVDLQRPSALEVVAIDPGTVRLAIEKAPAERTPTP